LTPAGSASDRIYLVRYLRKAMQGVDWGAYYWFSFQRNGAGKALRPVMEIANLLGSYLALAILAVAIMSLLLTLGRQRPAGAFGVLVCVAVLIGEGLKSLVGRPRPPDAEIILGRQNSPSFPNVSALLASMLLLILAMILGTVIHGRIRFVVYAVCLLLVLLIGASQLYLGLYFLTDLLAGWTAGVLLALVWNWWTVATVPTN
jgi:undecaprenyl-diphosphatase